MCCVPTEPVCAQVVVKRDVAGGDTLAFGGTPSVIVRGRLFDGALPLDSLESVLRVQKDEGNE